jgi:hypothetical protein
MALVILDKIVDLDPAEMLEAAKQFAADQNQTIELCRALMAKASWKTVGSILKNLEQEPESVRRAVLGYFNAVLINSGNPRAYAVIDCFARPYYDSGKAGLTASCFEAMSMK